MPSQDHEKHERLGTLGSGSTTKTDGKRGLAARFRPKNFSKPEAPSEDILTMVKKEPMDVDPQPSGPRRNRTGGPMAHKKKDIGQDQVVFGGGVGVASRAPKRTSAANMSVESTIREKTGQKSGSRAVPGNTEALNKVQVKEEDVNVSDSSSCDGEEDFDNVYCPTTVICPDTMAQSIHDIDSIAHGEASDRIAHLFEETSENNNGLMLFQIPEKLPVFRPKDVSEEQSCSNIDDLHNKSLGKLLITKSGKVKMKIGDVVFDVTQGVECRERQELALVDKKQSKFITLGAIHNRITVSPDISLMLSSSSDS